MSVNRDSYRYSLASIALHWLMLLIIVGAFATIEVREFYPKGSEPREALKNWHFMLGLLVLAMVWFRITARLVWAAPQSRMEDAAWQRAIATAVHIALYLFMIGMPIAGWMILSAQGDAIPFFGHELPAITSRNEALAEQIEELHEMGGTIGYWLIGGHAAAALFHHYIRRDNTIGRMLPHNST